MTAALAYAAAGWRYSIVARGTGGSAFAAPAFDDSGWALGQSPFASVEGGCGINATRHTTQAINRDTLVRRTVTIPAGATDVVIYIGTEDRLWVYWNGVLVLQTDVYATTGCAVLDQVVIPIADVDVLDGDNLLAIRASDDPAGGSFLDARVSYDAPVVPADAVSWDVYDVSAPNGPLLATIQDDAAALEGATERSVRVELNGTGQGQLKINRYSAVATEAILARGNLVKCRFPWRDGYDTGFVLEKGDFTLASSKESAGEEFSFGGRGLLAYLDRAVMDAVAYTTGLDISDTWTEVWEKAFTNPVGVAILNADPTYVYVIGETTRRIYKIRESDRAVVGSSPLALFTHYASGLSADPVDTTIFWALEAPWLSGSGANAKIHKVDAATYAILATFDLGSSLHLTDIRSSGAFLYVTNYSTDKIEKRSRTTGALVGAPWSISYGGVGQTNPNAVSINAAATEIAYWFDNGSTAGATRALIASLAAPTVITRKISTTGISTYGGDWTTEGGQDYFYMVSQVHDRIWKYQLTAATPHDPVNDKWRLDEGTPGAILWRIIEEAQAAARPQHPLPDLTIDFDSTTDSNGAAWDTHDGTLEFDADVTDSVLATALRLIPYGLVERMSPTLLLSGYNASSYGADKTGSFGAGKVRFEKGVNIIPELGRQERERELHSHMLATGKNSIYARATLADLGYVREGGIKTDIADSAALEGTAEATLGDERVKAERIRFAVPIGDDEDAGLYLPFTHYDVGDYVTLHTGSGEHDFDEETFVLYAFTLAESTSGKWETAILELGSATLVKSDTGGSSSGGSTGGGAIGGSGTTTVQEVTLRQVDDTGAVVTTASGRTLESDGWSVFQKATGVIGIVLKGIGRLLGLADVDADDITDGQVLVWDASLEMFVPGDIATGSLLWFNVRDYGAVGDGVTVDTAAIAAAIAALTAAGAGVLYFPAGTYLTAGGHVISVPCTILGDGSAGFDGVTGAVSMVACSSATAAVFTFTSYRAFVRGLAGNCVSVATPSAGGFIVGSPSTGLERIDLDTVSARRFWIGFDLQGTNWTARNTYSYGHVKYGGRVRNTLNVDAGDWSWSDSAFYSALQDSDAGLRIESSGGGKLTDVKFNKALDGFKHNFGIDLNVPNGVVTSILSFANVSIENTRSHGFNAVTTGTGQWQLISWTGGEIAPYNTVGQAFHFAAASVGKLDYVTIIGAVCATTIGSAQAAVGLTNVQHVTILIQSDEFGGGVWVNGGGSTDVLDLSSGNFGAPALTLGTANVAGTSKVGIATDATIALFDATAPTTSALGDAAAVGAAAKAARRDHRHGREAAAVAGDLSGTLPNPTVAKVQGVAVTDAGTTGAVLTKTGALTATWSAPSTGVHYEPVTSGPSSAPELVFTADGRCVMAPVSD